MWNISIFYLFVNNYHIMFSDEIIDQIWEKGRIVEGFDPATIRKDACGAWILRNQYGMTNSDYGWVIDHVYPTFLGGDDNPENLRPMQWKNNVSKGNDYPIYMAEVRAEGAQNIPFHNQYTVREALQQRLQELYHI